MKNKFWTEYDAEVHAMFERIKKAIRAAKFRNKRKKVERRNTVKPK